MNHTVLKFVSILLVLCVLSVGGLAQAQSVEHAGHHAHHHAATHGTVLCSLMCAAGQMLDVEQVTPPIRYALLTFELLPVTYAPLHHTVDTPTSRGPPILSLYTN